MINRGRVVVVTALESDSRYQQLVAAVETQLAMVNKEAATGRIYSGGSSMPSIEQSEVIIYQLKAFFLMIN